MSTIADTAGMAVVRDRKAGTVTAVLRVHGHGFPLASAAEQDAMLVRVGRGVEPVRAGTFAGIECDVAGVGAPGGLGRPPRVPRLGRHRRPHHR